MDIYTMQRMIFILSIASICIFTNSAVAQSRTLPEGRFVLFGGNSTAVNFLISSSVHRSGDLVNVTTYRVYKDAIPTPSGSIDQDTTELEIDCVRRTYREVAVNAYRPDGRWAFAQPAEPAKPIEPDQTWDFVAKIVCDGVRLPDTAAVNGAAAARVVGLTRLKSM